MKSYALIALLAFSLQFANPCSSENQGNTPGPNDTVFDVEVLPVKFENKPRIYSATGTFDYSEIIEIKANADGIIEKFYTSDGDRIEKGDPVFSLSNSSLIDEIELKRARIKEYNSRINLANAKLDDSEDINPNAANITSDDIEFLDEEPVDKPIEKDFDNSRTAESPRTQQALILVLENRIDRLTKEAEILDKRLLNLNHTSPVNGVQVETYFSEGNPVKFQDTILKMAQTSPMTLTFQLPENLVNFVNKRTKIEIRSDNNQDVLATGRVFYISPNLNKETKSLTLKANIENEDALLKGGQSTSLFVISNKMDRVLRLPESVIVSHDDKNFIFIALAKQARLIEVKKIHSNQDGNVVIQANLSVGDRVILNPDDDLKNGSFINVKVDESVKDALDDSSEDSQTKNTTETLSGEVS